MLKLLFAACIGYLAYQFSFTFLVNYATLNHWAESLYTLKMYSGGAALLAFALVLNMLSYIHLRVQQHFNAFILLALLSAGGYAGWTEVIPKLLHNMAP